MSNRRRRSILKSSGRNSVAPEVDEEVEDRRGMKDTHTTTTSVTLPFAARKRVSFGQPQIKEFEVPTKEKASNAEQTSRVQQTPNGEQTMRGEVDMEFSSDEDEMNKTHANLEDELENMPPSRSMMNRTNFGGSMAVDETYLDRTGLTLPPFPSSPTHESGDRTVWGGTMGVEVDFMNQTYAVPPMSIPKHVDHTIYGGAIEGLEATLLNQTFVRDAVAPRVNQTEIQHFEDISVKDTTIPPVKNTAIPPIRCIEIAPVKDKAVSLVPAVSAPPPPAPAACLKIAVPASGDQQRENLPVKRPRKQRNKLGIFGTAITPKRPLFSKEEKEESHHEYDHHPVASAFCQTSFTCGSSTVALLSTASADAQTSPLIIGKKEDESPKIQSNSFGLQTSFAFTYDNGVDAQTSPFVFTKDISLYGGSPLRCETLPIINGNLQLEHSPNHIAMISTCMENVTLPNPHEEFQSNFNVLVQPEQIHPNITIPLPLPSPINENMALASTSYQIPIVEESLAELSLQEPSTLKLSDELQYFVEHSNELDRMDWIICFRLTQNEVSRIPKESWKEFESKHSHVFMKRRKYWGYILQQRDILMQIAEYRSIKM